MCCAARSRGRRGLDAIGVGSAAWRILEEPTRPDEAGGGSSTPDQRYLGEDGGGGVGSGPDIAVGAALGLEGQDRFPVAVMGDGDFLMGCSALWTAAHYRIPLLVVIVNNRSYFNDKLHQERAGESAPRYPIGMAGFELAS